MDALINEKVFKALEEKLNNYEKQYQRLIDGLPDILYSFSISRGGIFYSPGVSRILGYTPEYLLEHPQLWSESIHPDDRSLLEDAIRDFILGKCFEIEYRIRHAQGHWIWLRDRSISFHEHDDELIIQGIAADITELRCTAELLDLSTNSSPTASKQTITLLNSVEGEFRLLFNNMLNGYASCRMIHENGRPQDFIYLRVNQAFEKLTGLQNVVGKRVSELIPDIQHTDAELFNSYARVAQSGTAERFEYYLKSLNKWFDVSVYSLEQDHFVALFDVITERKQAERELKENEQRLNFYVDHSPMATVEWDANFMVTRWAGEAENIFGWSKEETVGKPVMELHMIYEEDIPIVENTMRRLMDGNSRYVLSSNRNYTKSGRVIHCEWFNTLLTDSQGKLLSVLSQVMDITERKRTEDELIAGKETLQVALESMSDAVFISDAEGRFISFNSSFVTFHRFKSKEECAGTLAEYPDIIDVFMANGEPVPLEMWAVPRALRGETGTGIEYSLRRKDTGEAWVGSYSFAPIRNRDGAIVGSVVTGRDITEYKHMEAALLRTNDDLERQVAERTEKLRNSQEKFHALVETTSERIWEFLSNMSHEIRTPLNAIFLNLQLLTLTGLSGEQSACLDSISNCSQDLLSLISDILDLSRIEAGKIELEQHGFSLRKSIADVIKTQISKAYHKGLYINTVIPEETPDSLMGDQLRFKQIILNLLVNSIKFTESGFIAISVVECKPFNQGVLLTLEVTDTGIGIHPDTIHKIFQAFSQADSSTTRKYGGSGLGLAICSRLAELMGGRTWVESIVGNGSTFSVQIPFALNQAEETVPRVLSVKDLTQRQGPPLTILVVDDQELNLLYITSLLQKCGHTVVTAADGYGAVEKFASCAFDVVLMDVQMPGMNGMEATRIIRERETENGGHTLIIAVTARALREEKEKILAEGFDGYISKPIEFTTMMEEIRRLIQDERQFGQQNEEVQS